MAGLSNEGFTTKRLQEIIESYNSKAVELFQELLDEGDTVDTSPNSTIGRMIGVVTPSTTDLWEAALDVYSAFDPNSATGVALDNIVAYGGLTRQSEGYDTTIMVLTGVDSQVIPEGTLFEDVQGRQFALDADYQLTNGGCCGIQLTVANVVNSGAYNISYFDVETTLGATILFTADGSATKQEILDGVTSVINTTHASVFTATNDGETLTITPVNLNALISYDIAPSVANRWTIYRTSGYATAQAVTSGALNVPENTITEIVVPNTNLDSVFNVIDSYGGRDAETDEELRERFRIAKYTIGGNIYEGLYSDLLNLPGVKNVRIYENTTNAVVNGVDPHAFECVVEGGLSQDIADTIWKNKPAGIATDGTVAIVPQTISIQGTVHNVKFSRPTYVPIKVTMTLTKGTTSTPVDGLVYPADGDATIKKALIEYVQNTFTMGDNVLISRLYTPINTVSGHYVTDLQIGKVGSAFGTTNITMAATEIPTLDISNITIV